MDFNPSPRHNNQPFSLDPTAPIGSALESHSFYYKQFTNSPLQLSSEWGENNELNKANLPRRNSAGSPSMIKLAANAAQSLEETPTPTRKFGLGRENAFTPGKVGTLAVTGPPPIASTSPKKGSIRNSVQASSAPTKEISTMDVLFAMLNDLTGKDKMAKLSQYSLRLLIHHARKTQTFLSDEKVNIELIASTYASNDKIMSLIVNFAKNPRSFARVLIILVCSTFTSRLSGFVPALGVYRQLLRFGKSPFRFNILLEKVKTYMYKEPKSHVWRINDKVFNKGVLGDCISLYYNVNDDISFLYKVKFLHNMSLKAFAGRHEAYAWYCDSWFALYNAYNNLQRLSQKEFDLKISIQVKRRSRTLSKQILGGNSLQANGSHSEDEARDSQALKDIQFRITNTKLDVLKLVSDIIFNSYTVFNARLHFDTVQIWMGISASFLGSVKLFREKKKALAKA